MKRKDINYYHYDRVGTVNWPIEFIIYGFIAIHGIVCAYVGRFIRKKIKVLYHEG